MLASLAVIPLSAAAATYFEGRLPLPASILQIVNFLVGFGLMTTLFTLIYKTCPMPTWPGAMHGSVLS